VCARARRCYGAPLDEEPEERTVSQIPPDEQSGSTFTWNEDWLAAVAGLALLALVLLGVIPEWLVP